MTVSAGVQTTRERLRSVQQNHQLHHSALMWTAECQAVDRYLRKRCVFIFVNAHRAVEHMHVDESNIKSIVHVMSCAIM